MKKGSFRIQPCRDMKVIVLDEIPTETVDELDPRALSTMARDMILEALDGVHAVNESSSAG